MSRPALTRLGALIASCALTLYAGAAPGQPAAPRPRTASLAGQLLVATPEMGDPRFAETVIYMVKHDATGAQGLVLNRPLGEISLSTLLEQMGMEGEGANGSIRVHVGGPVEGLRAFVLHTADYAAEGTLIVKDGFAMTWDPEILRAMAAGKGPRRSLFAVGYAGWAPGQLEAEMRSGGWVRAAADEALLFDTDYDSKWQRAMARRKIDL